MDTRLRVDGLFAAAEAKMDGLFASAEIKTQQL